MDVGGEVGLGIKWEKQNLLPSVSLLQCWLGDMDPVIQWDYFLGKQEFIPAVAFGQVSNWS